MKKQEELTEIIRRSGFPKSGLHTSKGSLRSFREPDVRRTTGEGGRLLPPQLST